MKKKISPNSLRKLGWTATAVAVGPILFSAASNAANSSSVESPYAACKGVRIISDDEYKKDVDGWNRQLQSCGGKLQVSPDTGFTKGALDAKWLADSQVFMTKVAERFKMNLEHNITELKAQQNCLNSDDNSKDCQNRKNAIHGMLNKLVPEARMHLALSRGADIAQAHSPSDDRNINTYLEPWSAMIPNPARGQLAGDELAKVKQIYAQEKERVKKLVADKMSQRAAVRKNANVNPSASADQQAQQIYERQAWEQIQGEHRAAYRKIMFDVAPLLSALPPSEDRKATSANWSDKQIASTLGTMIANAEKEKKVVDESLAHPKLEFDRLASAKDFWQSYVKGKRDLLDYAAFSNIVNDVLKQDPASCGLATGLTAHLHDKEAQEGLAVGVGSLAAIIGSGGAGGALLGAGAAGGAAASAFMGIALGVNNVADSYKEYKTVDARVKSRSGASENEVKIAGDAERKEAESGLATAVAFHGLDYAGAGAAGKLAFNASKKGALKLSSGIAKALEIAPKGSAEEAKAVEAAVKETYFPSHEPTKDERKLLDQFTEDFNKKGFMAKANDPEEVQRRALQRQIDVAHKVFSSPVKTEQEKLATQIAKDAFGNLDPAIVKQWDDGGWQGFMAVYGNALEELRGKKVADLKKFKNTPKEREALFRRALDKAGAKKEDEDFMVACMTGAAK